MSSVSRADVDAVIISDSQDDDPALEASFAANIPVLTNDRLTDDRVTVHVDSGYAEMTEFSFDLFRARGRLRPGILTEPSALHSDAVPERTWRALCEKNDVQPLIEQVAVDRHNLSASVKSLLDQGADSIYSFAGEGLEVADIIEASGKTLGTDVLLVTCEIGTPLPTVERGISTLRYHAERGTLLGVPVLLQILDNSLSAPQTVSLGWEFIEGASTGDPAA
jgi:DNA-binding LacI/PurR family transcriptional regulator